MEEDGWKEVYCTPGMIHAKPAAGRLTAEGIETRLKYEAAGVIYAITVDGLGEVRILVPEGEWDRARDILAKPFDERDLDWERNPE